MPVARPRLMLADKGYDGDDVRTALLMKRILPVIPPKTLLGMYVSHDRKCCQRISLLVEKMISKFEVNFD